MLYYACKVYYIMLCCTTLQYVIFLFYISKYMIACAIVLRLNSCTKWLCIFVCKMKSKFRRAKCFWRMNSIECTLWLNQTLFFTRKMLFTFCNHSISQHYIANALCFEDLKQLIKTLAFIFVQKDARVMYVCWENGHLSSRSCQKLE